MQGMTNPYRSPGSSDSTDDLVIEGETYRFELGTRILFGGLSLIFLVPAFMMGALSKDRLSIINWVAVIDLLLFSLPLLNLILWRVRIDRQGVHQTFLGREITWPWEVFEDGLVEVTGGSEFTRKDWPRWRPGRKLHLSLGYAEKQEALQRMRLYCEAVEDPFAVIMMRRDRKQTLSILRRVAKVLWAFLLIGGYLIAVVAIAVAVLIGWLLCERMLGVNWLGQLDHGEAELVLVNILLLTWLATHHWVGERRRD